MSKQVVKTIKSATHGAVTYVYTPNEFGHSRVLRGKGIFRSQRAISKVRYAEYQRKGGFFSAGCVSRLVWAN